MEVELESNIESNNYEDKTVELKHKYLLPHNFKISNV